MKFSDRVGITNPKSVIQLNDMDFQLRSSLWNFFYDVIWNGALRPNVADSLRSQNSNPWYQFTRFLCENYFKRPVDEIPSNKTDLLSIYKNIFFHQSWYESYNLLEIIFVFFNKLLDSKDILHLNRILERERSGYRLLDNKFVPISDSVEVKEIETTLGNQDESSIHIRTAIEALSNKENPDYRNCIKESISAVEATARQITNTSTLDKALKKLETNGIQINAQLKSGIEKMYHYTNDSDAGIRHCLLDSSNSPRYEEAKYMLVVCSAFVNLLKGWNIKHPS